MYSFTSYLNNLKDYFVTDQLEAFLAWVRHTPSAQLGSIFVAHGPRYYYTNNRGKSVPNPSVVQFIFCAPNQRREAQDEVGLPVDNWYPLFSSPALEVWENRKVHSAPPLRFGLTTVEAASVLTAVRTTLMNELTGSTLTAPEPTVRLSEVADLDVTLWVEGELRGSIVLTNVPFQTGACHSARLASVDNRFKPLQAHELSKLQVEIAHISTLRIPFLNSELPTDTIYHDKTYHLAYKDTAGWYIPAAFNSARFYSLRNLIESLLEQKMKLVIPTRLPLPTIAATESFVETSTGHIALRGPVPRQSQSSQAETASQAFDFLARQQETDGNIRPTFDPFTHKSRSIDWVRLAFTYFALRKYALIEPRASAIAERLQDFLLPTLHRDFHYNPTNRLLTRLYCLSGLRLVNGATQSEQSLLKATIRAEAPTVLYDPITYAYLAHFALTEGDTTWAVTLMTQIETDFIHKKTTGEHIDTASYPELLALYQRLRKLNPEFNFTYRERHEALRAWYLEQQLPNGSFRANQNTTFCYTRGTSKIIEVLTEDASVPQTVIDMGFKWLSTMQYTDNSMFFIAPELRSKLHGGFRHDYFNPETWIDTNAHIVCAFANLPK